MAGNVDPNMDKVRAAVRDGKISPEEALNLKLAKTEAEAKKVAADLTKALASGEEVPIGDFLVHISKGENGKKLVTTKKANQKQATQKKNNGPTLAQAVGVGVGVPAAGAVIGGIIGGLLGIPGGPAGIAAGAAAGAKIGGGAGLVADFGLFAASCSPADDIDEYTVNNNNNIGINLTVNVSQAAQAKIDSNPELKSIVDLLTQLLAEQKNHGQNIDAIKVALESALNQLANANAKIDDITALLTKIQQNQVTYGEKADANAKKIIDIQTQILNAIGKLGTDNAKYFNQLLTAITQNGAKLDDLKALLNAINNNVISGNKAQEQQVAKILEALGKLNFQVVTGADKIVDAVLKGKADLDAIVALLTRIEKAQAENHKEGMALGNAILEAIGKISISGGGDVSGLEAKLDKILAQLIAGNGKMADMTALLQKINNGVVKNGETQVKILDAIEKYGAEGIKLGNAILDAINKIKVTPGGSADTSAIEAKLDKILAELVKGNGKMADMTALLQKINNGVVKNGETQVKILEAIEKLGVNVAGGLNVIIDKMSKQPDYNAKLDAILNKLGDIDNNNAKNFAAVIDAINKKASGGVDIQPILDKLDEILQAIKDHDVKVTVDVTGKVTCECNCNCGGNHEGILGDLNAVLG